MNDTIKLPAGHKWKEVESFSAAETCFQCTRCDATFTHDGMDGSITYEGGDGSCDAQD